jgi:hypothetical protein
MNGISKFLKEWETMSDEEKAIEEKDAKEKENIKALRWICKK